MKIFISAGEPSGDIHGCNLAASLQKMHPGIEISGFGGPKMRSAGVDLLYPLAEHAVIGFIQVARMYGFFVERVKQAADWFEAEKPDAVVLIDYPGMNWWVARRATERGIPVYYFVPPQIWAWGGWRVGKMKRYVNEAFANFPFENDWYSERGMPNTWVGHPYFDELAGQQIDQPFVEAIRGSGKTVIGMLPGSRTQELENNVPSMLRAACRLNKQHPGLEFHFACLKEKQKVWVTQKIASKPEWAALPVTVHAGKTPEIIEVSRFCIAVSGSVSLELLWRKKPCVTIYHAAWFYIQLAKVLKRCRYASLVNLLAGKELSPEFVHYRCRSRQIARVCHQWLKEPETLNKVVEELTDLRETWAIPGACERAARLLLERVAAPSSRPARSVA